MSKHRFILCHTRIALAILSLLVLVEGRVFAQRDSMVSQMDSTVFHSTNGDTQIKYFTHPIVFGSQSKSSKKQKPSFILSEEEKQMHYEAFLVQKERSLADMISASRSGSRDVTSYAVGAIPMEEGTTPSGARTYQIPITTASGFQLTPTLFIGYNSQAGEGWVGYGWDIHGLSSISLISKNSYYHNEIRGANTTESWCSTFALDGNPLVTNTQPSTKTEYPLITASGHILAAPEKNSYGFVSGFTVLYPNGIRAHYGLGANSNNTMPSYPITQMTDLDGNKITFSYITDATNGNDRISAIRYGYNASDQYRGEITFSYVSNPIYSVRYYAGKSITRQYKLSSIVSKSAGTAICQYEFTYEQKDNVNLLSQVDCSSDGENLRPLRFEYGPIGSNQPSDSHLEKQSDSLLMLTAFPPGSTEYIYRRGKFRPGSYNDGLVVYPRFEEYGLTVQHQPFIGPASFEFGSLYDPMQTVLIASDLTDVMFVNSIMVGSGFQTLDAVDVDGDGLDELVKVNFNGVSGTNTLLQITVYKINSWGVPVQNNQFQVSVKGTVTSGSFVSPYRRAYYWGDFLGNGRVQLLTVAFDKNYNTRYLYDQTSYAALIDISAQTKLCDSQLFTFPIGNYRSLIVCDLDNDSQTELCYATASGMEVYRYQSSSSSFSHFKSFSNITSSILSSTDRPYHLTDLNGDGYLDIMCPPVSGTSTYWNRYAYNGASFVSSGLNITSRLSGDEMVFMDVNRDGMADLVKISGTNLGNYINQNGSSFGPFQLSPNSISDAEGIVPANVIDLYGMSCFIKVNGFYVCKYNYTNPSPEQRQLTLSTDSFGRKTFNTYQYLPENSIDFSSYPSLPSLSDGYIYRTLPIYVLSAEDSYMTDECAEMGHYKQNVYRYYDSVIHQLGLGFCGFSMFKKQDLVGPVSNYITQVYDPQKRGVTTAVELRQNSDNGTPYSTIVNTYDNNSTTYGKLNPRLIRRVENDVRTGIETTTSYTYGDYDLPRIVLTSRRIGTDVAKTERLTRNYLNSVTTSKYVLGVIRNEYVDKRKNENSLFSWREYISTFYDSNYHPTKRQRYVGRFCEEPTFPRDTLAPVFPRRNYADSIPALRFVSDSAITIDPDPEYASLNLELETRWQYDSYGHVTSEKSAHYGATEFIGKTYTYDNNGRYVTSKTDELGHTVTYNNYSKFGEPRVVVNDRGKVTYYTFDAWGNNVGVSYPDGKTAQTTYAWGGSELYTITKSATGQPETVVHYDALGREVRSGIKRFDGQWQWTDIEYDKRGNVRRKSLPFRGASSSYWNRYSYDTFNRPDSLIEASGRVTAWSYNGTSVTEVKDGITSTKTTDAKGNVVSITDAGGTITYNLRDDDQPSSVAAPGNVVTSFSYDGFGRRTQIVDPSAGTQTDAYEWNNDGSSLVTHTNPNGIVKTHRDKYGRITLIERPGEYNTTYTYNTYGLLTSESSTNGTGKEFTYDVYDRLVTAKETVPDGKWLQKAYNYGTGSILSNIQYALPSGEITTETYLYANGHNIGITLPDGTYIWHLTSENDLGMATAITSGTISREYGFTAFGMPTFRKMNGGNLQYFTYQFDVSTGNLLSRSDMINGQTETFDYDNLNRLIAIGSRQISYAANGNILSMDGVGTMTYGTAPRPYQITMLTPEDDGLVPDRQQSVSYTCFNRPSSLLEGGKNATFKYNGSHERVKMTVIDGVSPVLSRYYIGNCYEFDQTPAGTKERLFLGGDAYSAPMVYQRENNGSWTAYNIGRDYLGNITHLATTSGTLVAEYSYDPWGRLRNPETLEIYAPGYEPELFLGRGFTGHEHLTWFGLVNMNARLYDPLLGRFLSPDPYVQAPDFTQNFNRYSYALNNPLKYTDPSGNYIIIDSFLIGLIGGGWKRAMKMAWNDLKIWGGLFNTDNNKSFGGQVWELVSRFTWQAKQTVIGFFAAQTMNTLHLAGGVQDVDYLHGATIISTGKDWTAFTLSNYIMGGNRLVANNGNELFQHEYGHYIQSQSYGPLYISKVGIPSLFSKNTSLSPHHNNPTEQDANIRALKYFKKYYTSDFDTSDASDNYNGLWNSNNDINGMQWNNYKANAINNELILSQSPISISWYDVVLNLIPIIGDIADGIINTVQYNKSY